MGSCMSCCGCGESDSPVALLGPTAKVVSATGDLFYYNLPISVFQVLHAQKQLYSSGDSDSASTAAPSSNYFLCNSDLLLYDEYIPALDSRAQLQPNQIYFVLPKSKLQYRLTASDMAAMAVKASLALQNSNTKAKTKTKTKASNRRNKSRISPLLVSVNPSPANYNWYNNGIVIDANSNKSFFALENIDKAKTTKRELGQVGAAAAPVFDFSRSGSVKKLRRYTSRRAKLAVRSFKLRLTTIYEGTVL